MKTVSRFMEPNNHIVKDRNRDGNLVSFCGSTFPSLIDGDLDDLDSLGVARLCERCVAASGYQRPSVPGWRDGVGRIP